MVPHIREERTSLTMESNPEHLLESAVITAVEAGRAALEHYGDEIPVDYKSDNSPLTLADRASHEHIVEALARITPEIPVLSEESPEEETRDRRSWSSFWLVDPLDGTKEFIKKTGQFTVNIALVRGDETCLGVVHVPVSGVTYTGLRTDEIEGAWVQAPNEPRKPIRTRSAAIDRLTVVASRDHAGPRVKAFIERLSGAEATSMGSSLKFCLIAEGQADFYPRVVPTMEWDTGAAQCIVEAAGGRVTDLEGRRLTYNKDDLRNPSIMSFGDPEVDWVRFFAE
jgi:3'(2'), 5'-bisphosphate nucleotidase